MKQLTPFQVECEAALVAALGTPIVHRTIAGETENFITGLLPGSKLKVYIYLDGAEISGGPIDERFERPDFDTLNQLQTAFIKKAIELKQEGV